MQLRLLTFLLSIIVATLLASCMLGPNFHSPCPPCTCGYTEPPSAKKTVSIKSVGQAGKAQHFLLGRDIPAEWWRIFHSPQINGLICAGLANSPNLAAAKAVLLQAQENYAAQVGTLYPQFTGNLTAQRQSFSEATLGGIGGLIFNLIDATVSVSYTLDVFGGLRRQVEAACAQADSEKYELEAAFMTMSSNIVTTSITIASLKAQIAATNELIQEQEEILTILKKQFSLGGASEINVLTQETQLGQLRATLPPLKQSLVQNLHTLSILIGELPCEDRLPQLDLDKLYLPGNLPISLPSMLVRQRPDVQAAEALIHVASAQIGVATANLFPQLTLTGNYGFEGPAFGGLLSPGNKIWNLTGGLAQPIFSGGTLFARRQVAIAAFQQAAAQYRQTVLQAFQNVADTLRALQHDALLLKAQKAAEIAAHRNFLLARQQFRLGGVNFLNLLTAEKNYQQARIARIQAQAARYTDTAALFLALGGGWWNHCCLECDPLLDRNVKQYKPECFG